MDLNLIIDLDNPIWKQIEWLNLDTEEKEKVKGVIPEKFDHYFKLFTSVGVKKKGSKLVETSTYRAVAESAGIDFKNNFTPYNVIEKFRGIPEDIEFQKEEDISIVNKLVEIFGSETECYFHGFGDDQLPEDFMISWVAKGKVKDFPGLFNAMNEDGYELFNFFPEYIFAENKEWCLGNIFHQSGIYLLGCNKEIAGKIKNQDVIEFQELKAEDIYI